MGPLHDQGLVDQSGPLLNREYVMWYFAWVLGLGLAVCFGILNGIWLEYHQLDEPETQD
ncbi:cytochrome bd-I oxidase subunit CydX [Bordetella genomosp. 8]